MGKSQLGRIAETLEKKRKIANWYTERLTGLPGVGLPVEEPWAWHVYWMYALTIGPEAGLTRDAFTARLKQEGVDTRDIFLSDECATVLSRDSRFSSSPVSRCRSVVDGGVISALQSLLERGGCRHGLRKHPSDSFFP